MSVWLVRLVALGALFAGRAIVIPGVDPMALAAMRQSSGGLLGLFNVGSAAIDVSLFTVAGMPLLVVSLVLVLLGSPDPLVAARLERIGAMVYLAWCTVSAYTQALYLEAMGRGGGIESMLLTSYGLRFRAMAVLTWVAAAALLWFLAKWVTNRGAILGAALFTGALVAVQDVELLLQGFRSARAGEPLLGPLFHALPWMVALGALWLFAPKQWPVRAPAGFTLNSRLEVVLLPIAAGQLALSSGLPTVPLACGLAVVVAIALSKEKQGRGSPLYLMLGAVLPLPAVAVMVFPLLEQARQEREPGPFAGKGRFEVELSCAAATPEVVSHDAKIFEDRLKRSRVVSTVKAEGTKLQLSLEQIAAPQELLAAITPRYQLSFQLVARDESMLSPDALDWRAAGLKVASDYDGEVIVAPTVEGLAPLVGALEIPAGFELSYECRERSGAMGCAPRLLETGAALGGDTIVEASVTLDAQNEPSVALVFNAEGATQLANLSSETGRQLAIVLDGRVISAPTIQGRIDRGRANISMGRSSAATHQKRVADAQQLANGLQSRPLRCDWQTSSLNVKP